MEILTILFTIFCTFWVGIIAVYLVAALMTWDLLWPKRLTVETLQQVVTIAAIGSIIVVLIGVIGGIPNA